MDLEQARMYLERVTGQRISNSELAQALNMKLPNISKKLKEKSKLRQSHIEALERFYSVKLSENEINFVNKAFSNLFEYRKHIPTVPENSEDVLIERFMTNFRMVLKGDYQAYKTVKSMLKTLELTYGFVDKEE